jgi:ribosomal-protein-alanine N-acetyltransferase
MSLNLFPHRIETDRLVFERLSHDTVDPFDLFVFFGGDEWQAAAADHMPWFRFRRLDQVLSFVDDAEQRWADREGARYLLRLPEEGGALAGTARFGPEWGERRCGSDIVLAKEYWGRGYGAERASVFVELAFERYDLDAWYTTCVAGNEQSYRMIQKYVERYGGRHEGLLRQYSSRPGGAVTDQHRFSITREEYETATADRETLAFDVAWSA